MKMLRTPYLGGTPMSYVRGWVERFGVEKWDGFNFSTHKINVIPQHLNAARGGRMSDAGAVEWDLASPTLCRKT
jgi:hypothetical protein